MRQSQVNIGPLYTGGTSDIVRRVWQHRQGTASLFAARYRLTRLIYMERHEDIVIAIAREKTIKHWPRAWKLNLIEGQNPEWKDLWETLYT